MKNYKLKINDNNYEIKILSVEGEKVTLEVNGYNYEVVIEEGVKIKKPVIPKPIIAKEDTSTKTEGVNSTQGTTGKVHDIKSPLPGVIIDILVKPGDVVKMGQKLIILEAMKMENTINSTVDGKVKSINVNKGDSVMEGDILIQIEN